MTIHLNLMLIEVNQLSGSKFHRKIQQLPSFFIHEITMQADRESKRYFLQKIKQICQKGVGGFLAEHQ